MMHAPTLLQVPVSLIDRTANISTSTYIQILIKKAKEQFKKQENKPMTTLKRYFQRFTPYFMALIGLILNYIIRRILDYFGRKIF